MASVAAEQAAEALRAAEKADIAQQAALREAEEARAAAALAARRAADARAAAEKATAVESGEDAAGEPVQGPLIGEPVIKELLMADTPAITADVQLRERSKTGRTWAALAVTAIVAGAAWLVTQSDGSRDDASPGALADKSGVTAKTSRWCQGGDCRNGDQRQGAPGRE